MYRGTPHFPWVTHALQLRSLSQKHVLNQLRVFVVLAHFLVPPTLSPQRLETRSLYSSARLCTYHSARHPCPSQLVLLVLHALSLSRSLSLSLQVHLPGFGGRLPPRHLRCQQLPPSHYRLRAAARSSPGSCIRTCATNIDPLLLAFPLHPKSSSQTQATHATSHMPSVALS